MKYRDGWEAYWNASTVRKLVDIDSPPITEQTLILRGIPERLQAFYYSHYQWQRKRELNNKNK